MMARTPKSPPKNPTNAQVIEAVQDIKLMVVPLVKDVEILMQDKRDREIAKKAVEEYIKSQPTQSPSTNQGSEQWLNRELVKTLGIAMAVILALVELMVQLKGVIK